MEGVAIRRRTQPFSTLKTKKQGMDTHLIHTGKGLEGRARSEKAVEKVGYGSRNKHWIDVLNVRLEQMLG